MPKPARAFEEFRGLGVQVLGFRGLGFGGLGVQVLGFWGLGFRGLGFRANLKTCQAGSTLAPTSKVE